MEDDTDNGAAPFDDMGHIVAGLILGGRHRELAEADLAKHDDKHGHDTPSQDTSHAEEDAESEPRVRRGGPPVIEAPKKTKRRS